MHPDSETFSARIIAALCTIAIVLLLGMLGNFDYADALEREAEEKVARATRARLTVAEGALRMADARTRRCEARSAEKTGLIAHAANEGALRIDRDLIVQCYRIQVPPFRAARVDPRLAIAEGRP